MIVRLTLPALLATSLACWALQPKDGQARVVFHADPKAELSLEGQAFKKREVKLNVPEGELGSYRLDARFPGGILQSKKLLVRSGWNIEVPVRDPRVDRPELIPQFGHVDTVYGVTATKDGKYAVTAGADRIAIVWDVATGKRLRHFEGHRNFAMDASLSPDGTHVAVAVGRHEDFIEPDGAIAVYPLRNDVPLVAPREPVETPMRKSRFHPNGKELLYAGENGTLYLRELQGKFTVRKIPLPQGTAAVVDVAYNRDGTQILAAYSGRQAAIWDVATAKPVKTYSGADLSSEIVAVDFKADGSAFLIALEDGNVSVVDAKTFQPKTIVHPLPKDTRLRRAAFSPDGAKIAVASGGSLDSYKLFGDAAVYDAATGARKASLKPKNDFITALCWLPEGKLLTGTWLGRTEVWDTNAATADKPLARFGGEGDRVWIPAISPDPDGRTVAFASGATLLRWRPNHPKQVDELGTGKSQIVLASWDRTGKRFVTGEHAGIATVRDGADGRKILATLPASPDGDAKKGHTGWVLGAKLDKGGKRALTCVRAESVGDKRGKAHAYLWDVATAKIIRLFDPTPEGSVWDCDLSADDKFAAFSDGDRFLGKAFPGKATVYETDTGKKLAELNGHAETIGNVLFSPDGTQLLTCGFDRKMILWDWRAQKPLVTFDKSYFDRAVSAAAFTPDGKHVLAGSLDGKVRLFDLKAKKLVATFGGRPGEGHYGPIDGLALHPDGRHFLTCGDGPLRFWDLATGEQVAWLMTFEEGKEWLVVTPEGFFDGTEEGRKRVSFRMQNSLEPAEAERFFRDFHKPGLLQKVWSGTRPAAEAPPNADAGPLLKLVSPRPQGPQENAEFTAVLEAEDRGAGVGRVKAVLNGTVEIAPALSNEDGGKTRAMFKIDLVEGANDIVFRAEPKAKGAAESEAVTVRADLRKKDKPAERTLHIFAVGINDYTGVKPLKYAKDDAEAIVEMLKLKSAKAFTRIAPPTLLIENNKQDRGTILGELDALKLRVKKQDAVVVFLAGHGELDKAGEYFYIPIDFKPADRSNPRDSLASGAIPAKLLSDKIRALPGRDKIVILDTCHAAASDADFVTASQTTEKFNQGMSFDVLHAVGKDELALESDRLRHGLLSYSLLNAADGLEPIDRNPKLNQLKPLADAEVKSSSWINRSREDVPEIARLVFNREDYAAEIRGKGRPFVLFRK